jgi:hypothetical protein
MALDLLQLHNTFTWDDFAAELLAQAVMGLRDDLPPTTPPPPPPPLTPVANLLIRLSEPPRIVGTRARSFYLPYETDATDGPPVDSYAQESAEARIQAYVQQSYGLKKTDLEIGELIKMQHQEFTCKICYAEDESLFMKCKTCKSGEYHCTCMSTWTRTAQKSVNCLLCNTSLV